MPPFVRICKECRTLNANLSARCRKCGKTLSSSVVVDAATLPDRIRDRGRVLASELASLDVVPPTTAPRRRSAFEQIVEMFTGRKTPVSRRPVAPRPPTHTSIPYNSTEGGGYFPEFIIGRRKDGSLMTHTCEESKLDSALHDIPGAAHWATFVFFSPKVLDRYLMPGTKWIIAMKPGTSGDTYRLINPPAHWRCEFVRSRSRETGIEWVRLCLGVLAELPVEDRLHWRRYNLSDPVDSVEE
jgi:hypothetical protein